MSDSVGPVPISAELRTILAATAASRDPEYSPMWRAHRVALPAGWQALRVAFFQALPEPFGPDAQDTLAAVNRGCETVLPGILLHRRGADGREALQEFADDASPEAAFLGPDGRYLLAAQRRPAYAVLPLAFASSSETGPARPDECLVLIPLVSLPRRIGEGYAAPIIVVDRDVVTPEGGEA